MPSALASRREDGRLQAFFAEFTQPIAAIMVQLLHFKMLFFEIR